LGVVVDGSYRIPSFLEAYGAKVDFPTLDLQLEVTVLTSFVVVVVYFATMMLEMVVVGCALASIGYYIHHE
jgi:hypothetical protein